MTTGTWIQIIIYVTSFGSMAGAVLTKLKYLEKKMDKHNCLMERMAVVEQSTRSAHHRLDDMKKVS